MTAWIDFRTEPIMDIPEIEEFITGSDWTLTCTDINCNWVDYGERTPDWLDELNESFESHRQFHINGGVSLDE